MTIAIHLTALKGISYIAADLYNTGYDRRGSCDK